uniref:Activin_recp domain-containing protein n=1 Tax=Parastrongyloides trichosuri TaxID=131310 RepID=A0A0N4ZNZ4_PARTI
MLFKVFLILFLKNYYVSSIRCTVGREVRVGRIKIPDYSMPLHIRACEMNVGNCLNATFFEVNSGVTIKDYSCDNSNECIMYSPSTCVTIDYAKETTGSICCCNEFEDCNSQNHEFHV